MFNSLEFEMKILKIHNLLIFSICLLVPISAISQNQQFSKIQNLLEKEYPYFENLSLEFLSTPKHYRSYMEHLLIKQTQLD